MAPKKTKKVIKNTDSPALDKEEGFYKTEKALYELEIADLNKKTAELLTKLEEYEKSHQESESRYKKLDKDRSDIITYLNKNINNLSDENHGLKEMVKILQSEKNKIADQLKQTVKEAEQNFTFMKDQLNSQVKLLRSKLNALHEFKGLQKDLAEKFTMQEKKYEEQELHHKRVLYETEKKFIISKDKLKKEMEARLLKLAQDFQEANDMRIAASTHRLIRENIALNHELDKVMASQTKISNINVKLKEKENSAHISIQLAEEERDAIINKNILLLKVIDRLTNKYKELRNSVSVSEKNELNTQILNAKINKLTSENEEMKHEIRILEQNLLVRMNLEVKSTNNIANILAENNFFKAMVNKALNILKAEIKLLDLVSDEKYTLTNRKELLAKLFDILDIDPRRIESCDTLPSIERIYQHGELGIVPKSTSEKFDIVTSTTQSTKSFIESEKRNTEYFSSQSSSVESFKTIPSLTILSQGVCHESVVEKSIASFQTSIHTPSTQTDILSDINAGGSELQKKLAECKLRLQETFLKDFTQFEMQSLMKKKYSFHDSNSNNTNESSNEMHTETKVDSVNQIEAEGCAADIEVNSQNSVSEQRKEDTIG